ncbi:MAG: hypothetical protein ACKOC5_12645 [Chloroflexota bacterium]
MQIFSLADQQCGLCVIFIRSPLQPRVAGLNSEVPNVLGFAVQDNQLFAAAYAVPAAFNLRDPLQPVLADVTATPGLAMAVAARPGEVLVADFDGGLYLLRYR